MYLARVAKCSAESSLAEFREERMRKPVDQLRMMLDGRFESESR
jgi:hypothetical protein